MEDHLALRARPESTNVTGNWTIELDVARWHALVDLLLPLDEVASWRMATTMRGGEKSEEGGDCPDGGS
jgi:hypothetical protein